MNFVDKNCYSLIFKALEQFHYIDGLSIFHLKEYTTTNYPKKVMNMNYSNSNKNMLNWENFEKDTIDILGHITTQIFKFTHISEITF